MMHYMMCDSKVTTIPSATGITAPSVPLGRSNLNEVKLEMAWRLSLAMYNVGKPPMAPTSMASNVAQWVTFGPTTTAPNPNTASTTAAPMASTTTLTATMTIVPVTTTVAAPTLMHATSHALEFDKGG